MFTSSGVPIIIVARVIIIIIVIIVLIVITIIIHMDVQDFLDQGMVSESQTPFAVSLRVPDPLRSAALLQTHFDAHV